MPPTNVALIWHHHQPDYRDHLTGETLLPWVRFHGIKDYYGLAALLEEAPEVRAHVNLVPVLLDQIETLVRGEPERWGTALTVAAPDLPAQDRELFHRTAFYLLPANGRRRFPRIQALEAQHKKSALTDQDLLDLQVCIHLAWFHPLHVEKDEELGALCRQGSGYGATDLSGLVERENRILETLVSRYRKLQEDGQVELMTSPATHPILPILIDPRHALEAMPGVPLPQIRPFRREARDLLARARTSHERRFGTAPRGLWPSEGSLCHPLLTMAAEGGFAWMAGDEEVLGRSDFLARASRNPYRPHRAESGATVVFRDRNLSDFVGFRARENPPEASAEQLLDGIRRAGTWSDSDHPLVVLAMDGENPWEHFADGGVTFLRAFHRRLAKAKDVVPVHLSTFLEEHAPEPTIRRLFAGSWIGANFATWIGQPSQNRGWEHLACARDTLETAEAAGREGAATARTCLESGLGSDWFWWFGMDHSSPFDGEFDAIFRRHVRNVYTAMDLPVPESLRHPVLAVQLGEPLQQFPRDYLSVEIDGRRTDYFEWLGAGRFRLDGDQGAMALGAGSLIREVRYGYDRKDLFLRLDGAVRLRTELHRQGIRIRLHLGTPPVAIALAFPEEERVEVSAEIAGVRAAVDEILEIGVPLEAIGGAAGAQVPLFLEIEGRDRSMARVPRQGEIEIDLPEGDLEYLEWRV